MHREFISTDHQNEQVFPLNPCASCGDMGVRAPKNMACRADFPNTKDFLAQMRPTAGINLTRREVQVPKLLFRNSHWVDNLCQCESNLADPPVNQRLRPDSDLVGIQERYVSAAG